MGAASVLADSDDNQREREEGFLDAIDESDESDGSSDSRETRSDEFDALERTKLATIQFDTSR
jgi:hypothetical protein